MFKQILILSLFLVLYSSSSLASEQEYKTKYVNRYLLHSLSPTFGGYLNFTKEDYFSKIKDLNGTGWKFMYSVNPMSDESRCEMISYAENGLHLYFDNEFIYLASEDSLKYSTKSTGIRVDKGALYSPINLEYYGMKEKKRYALTYLLTSGGMSEQMYSSKMAELNSSYQDLKYYKLAKVGSEKFNSIVSDLSQGEYVHLGVVDSNGKLSFAKLGLLGLGDIDNKDINLFDLFGYAYLMCLDNQLPIE